MSDAEKTMEKIVSLAKRRGFIFQGSEIYGGLAGTWDYGPNGVALRNNIQASWWKTFIDDREDMYGVDAAILMNPRVWEASGHVGAGFADAMVEDVKTKKRYRADHLLEEAGVERAEGLSAEEMTAKIKELGLQSPEGNALGDVQQFNMMFETKVGASEVTAQDVYLRPETAQGIFMNYKNVVDSFHPKVPFGIGQIGKAFRNEITPRDFLFRVREFEQMEIEYFVRPEEVETFHEQWKKECWEWVTSIGIDPERMRWYEHNEDERSHYSDSTFDIQFNYSIGWKELYGVANRTDHDLKSHQAASNVKLEYFDQEKNERFLPYVVEPAVGVGRLVLALLESAYKEEVVDGEERVVLALPRHIAPVEVAVLPLMRKKPLQEKAREIFKNLNGAFRAQYDETGSIGKRYRRQDEIGTPACITIDFETLEDEAVTVRDRDTMQQERVAIEKLAQHLK